MFSKLLTESISSEAIVSLESGWSIETESTGDPQKIQNLLCESFSF